MLHAFKLGYLEQIGSGFGNKAALHTSVDPDGNYQDNPGDLPLGYEKWAFIPKNALPFLKYSAENNYCHVYMVDQPVTLVDASLCTSTYTDDDMTTGNTENAYSCDYANDGVKQWDSWRTILIGGMRYGGGCKDANPAVYKCDSTNTIDTNGDGTVDENDCVRAPLKTAGGQNIGLSSYFALDITDEDNPVFMWEYTHPLLGHSTSGPAIVRFNGENGTHATLGHWYVVFGSGPTGPVDKSVEQYLGTSDQDLRLFVLDMKTGKRPDPATTGSTMTQDYIEPRTGPIHNAYVHTMGKVMADFNMGAEIKASASQDFKCTLPQGNYQTDALFIGYTKKCDGNSLANPHPATAEYTNGPYGIINSEEPCPAGTWRNGGILRVLTGESADPAEWNVSPLIDNIGPVYAAPDKAWRTPPFPWEIDQLQQQVKVFVGTGRYFYERPDGSVTEPLYVDKPIADDVYTVRQILAVIDPCVEKTKTPEGPYANHAAALLCQDVADFPSLEVRYFPESSDPDASWVFTLDPQNEYEVMYDAFNQPLKKEGTNEDLIIPVGAERVTTNVKVQTTTETVYVTTFKPFKDQCSLGGVTHVYAIDMQTGGAKIRGSGIAIMQLSTGNIKKVDISKDFLQMGGRRTTGEVGITAVEAPLIPSPQMSEPRIMHIIERKQ